jgi:hypothetical protein
MHLDEEQVQRLLHGETTPTGGASVRDHLVGCEECRSRVALAERDEGWVLDRLRQVDHALPRVTIESVVEPVVAPRRRGGAPWGRLAAAVFLTLAAIGVAYAAPGSPFRGVLQHIVAWVGGAGRQPAHEAPLPGTGGAQAGIAVAPGERLTIGFAFEGFGGWATVSLTDGADVVVRARGGTTIFTSEVDGLAIVHRGPPGRFEILIPRRAPSVEIRVGDRRVLLAKASRVESRYPANGEGRYLVPLDRTP